MHQTHRQQNMGVYMRKQGLKNKCMKDLENRNKEFEE